MKESNLMTHRQLAEWLARGYGQTKWNDDYIYTDLYYKNDWDDIQTKALIRPWGSDKWIKPTVDIYERDCKCGD